MHPPPSFEVPTIVQKDPAFQNPPLPFVTPPGVSPTPPPSPSPTPEPPHIQLSTMYFSLYIQYIYVKIQFFISPPVHMNSMHQFIWIPWNSPYGFYGTVHMDSMHQSIWIPYGFHSQSPYFSHFSRVWKLVHMDSMESIWNHPGTVKYWKGSNWRVESLENLNKLHPYFERIHLSW